MTKEDIIKEFQKPERLIKFVLEDCMDLKEDDHYYFSWRDIDRQISIYFYADNDEKDIDIQKISHLNELLEKGFNMHIETLSIPTGLNVFNPEFLVNMNKLQTLRWPGSNPGIDAWITSSSYKNIPIPKLPYSIRSILQNLMVWTEVRNHLPSNNNIHSYREVLDKITSGDIVV